MGPKRGCLFDELSIVNCSNFSLNGALGKFLPFEFHSFEHLVLPEGTRTLTNEMPLLLTTVVYFVMCSSILVVLPNTSLIPASTESVCLLTGICTVLDAGGGGKGTIGARVGCGAVLEIDFGAVMQAVEVFSD